METVNIHEAKTHLSRLVEKAAKGESFIIAKAGKPMVKVEAIEPADKPKKSLFGIMKGETGLPEDFDIKAFAREEIEEMFYGKE